MGFLDFLKKDKPATQDSSPPPVDAPAPAAPPMSIETQEELFAPPSHLTPPVSPEEEKDAVEHAQPGEWEIEGTPAVTPPPVDTPGITSPFEQSVPTGSSPGVYEDVPLPPPAMQDPGFEEATGDIPEPFDDLPNEPTPQPDETAPVEPVEKPTVSDIELPDFTDDDFDMSEQEKVPEPVEAPPELVPEEEPESQPESLPELAEAEPEEPDNVPPMEYHKFGSLETAKFIGSDVCFNLEDDVKEVRKSLRAADNALLDALSYHEHGDEKLLKLATTVNDVQEGLIDLDAALFEE